MDKFSMSAILSSRLKVFMKQQGMQSIDELYSFIQKKHPEIGKASLYHYVAGTKEPKPAAIYAIADSLGVSIDYLFGVTDNPAPVSYEKTFIERTGLDDAAAENLKNIHDFSPEFNVSELIVGDEELNHELAPILSDENLKALQNLLDIKPRQVFNHMLGNASFLSYALIHLTNYVRYRMLGRFCTGKKDTGHGSVFHRLASDSLHKASYYFEYAMDTTAEQIMAGVKPKTFKSIYDEYQNNSLREILPEAPENEDEVNLYD